VSQNRPVTGHLLRRFMVGSGPLKRSSDRLEFLARVLLVCSLLTAIPVSLAVGTVAHTKAQTQATAEAADRHRVTARLLDEVAAASAGDAWESTDRDQVTAVWIDSAGHERRGTVSVPPGAKAGGTIFIWIDRAGHRTPPPLSDSDVTDLAAGQGFATFLGLAVVVLGAYLSVRMLLDRSRSRRWAAEWAAVEPVWRGMVP
jgi:hypothetical protein